MASAFTVVFVRPVLAGVQLVPPVVVLKTSLFVLA
jgi:hypothetical protein